MKVIYFISGLLLVLYLRLMSFVGKIIRRRGDCFVMIGGFIIGDRMGRVVVRMVFSWFYGFNFCFIMKEVGFRVFRGFLVMGMGEEEE